MIGRLVWCAVVAVVGACVGTEASLQAAEPFQAGFGKADITPRENVRLSGYAARSTPMEGVDEPLFVRAVAIRSGDGPVHVIAAADSIGFPGTLVKEIFERLPAEILEDRARFVMTATHSHTAPHVARGLSNLFPVAPTDEENAATQRYTDLLRDQTVAAVEAAIADLKPARVFVGEGSAPFAKNRRVIAKEQWTGFGEAPQGPVDHAVPVIRITDETGQTTRGLLFNYACHCTTFGPGHNRANGDWAGYAAKQLEAAMPGAVALCTIGCGADANPQREGPEQLQLAQKQGAVLADEVARVAQSEMREITAAPLATFGYAGLPVDRPGEAELRDRLKSGDANVRRHAEVMLETLERMGRLPETYPMPIQSWRFGDEFVMTFLGGEVVVDYALRIKQELGPESANADSPPDDGKPAAFDKLHFPGPVWVTAYANDVFGYVASERVRGEGGYEVDSSMIYYLQPGRWSTGTEEVVMRRVHELVRNTTTDRARSVDEALKTFTVPEGFEVDVIAAEPLIADPVNFTLAPDGRLWVVEMADYPRGIDGQGKPGGRVKVLSDTDHDGKYDAAATFLDDLTYPTGVWPWKDGAILSAAPAIFYAKDTDGDGKADQREVLYSGFKEANPQHRVNGFTYGLDGWLYLASGDTSQDILCHKTGETVNMAGRDIRIEPESGRLETLSGSSQCGRTRDDFGEWFGNNNSEPLYHYVIEDGDLKRNPFVASPRPLNQLTDPPAIPPVYPTSRTVDRFNDLWAADRYTSACSPLVVRDARLGEGLDGSVLVCEPVHNLVSRWVLQPDGVTFKAVRHPSEQTSEFFSSTDGWFRPVRTLVAPDGSIWVADMYRRVIEHPEWIPEAWQAQLDVRAGQDKGRIYRIRRKDLPAEPVNDYTKLTGQELAAAMSSPNGWTRDTAQRLLLERGEKVAIEDLNSITSEFAANRSQSLHLLSLFDRGELLPLLFKFGHDSDPRVRRDAVRVICSDDPESNIQLSRARGEFLKLWQDPDVHVRFQVALSLGNHASEGNGQELASIAIRDFENPWVRTAVLSSARSCAEEILREVLREVPASEARTQFVAGLTSTAMGDQPEAGAARILALVAEQKSKDPADWQLAAVGACLDGLARANLSLGQLAAAEDDNVKRSAVGVGRVFDAARRIAVDSTVSPERRQLAVAILGRGAEKKTEDLELLASLLSPQQPKEVQTAAVEAMADTGDESVPARLLGAWKSLEPAVHSGVVSVLLSRDASTTALLQAIAAGDVHASELDASSRARLAEYPTAEIREQAATLLQPAAARKEVLDQYRSVLSLKGDAVHGAAVFTKTCAVCHQMHGRGNDIGAKLAALTNKSTENLLASILDPNQAVEGKFLNYSAAMKDGRTYSGMIIEETATSITLARPDGKKDVLLRIDLEQLSSSGKSFMPEGLEKELSLQDVADVAAFLQAEKVD